MPLCSLSNDGNRIVSESRLYSKYGISRLEVDIRTGNVVYYTSDLTPGEGEFVRLVRSARKHVAL